MAPAFGGTYPDLTGLIYYFMAGRVYPEFYDANDFVLKFAAPEDYTTWKQALDRAVILKRMATQWIEKSSYFWNRLYGKYFTVTPEKFGGVSMFVPVSYRQDTDNLRIRQMAWYHAAGYDAIGW